MGGPCSGKTTVAQALAKRFALKLLAPAALVAEALQAAGEADAVAAADAAAAAGTSPRPGGDGAGKQQAGVPHKARLGRRLRAELAGGAAASDELLVELLVLGMEEAKTWVPPPEASLTPLVGKAKAGATGPAASPAPAAAAAKAPVAASAAAAGKPGGAPALPGAGQPACRGFVLDGFPATAAQAALLERRLTGLDVGAEVQLIQSASQLVPPPEDCLPLLARPRRSGLDAVLVLALQDEHAAARRALGCRLDPVTGAWPLPWVLVGAWGRYVCHHTLACAGEYWALP